MTNSDWTLGPFSRPVRVLDERAAVTFACPVAKQSIEWAAKDLFNPGAVVRDDKVCLLVRAEDRVGRYAGTSRIGLATSSDGRNFALDPEPVIAPGDDQWQAWEWPGGCEDPRVVEAPDGTYVCTYTAFDGKCACLFVATSPDLKRWTKHGNAFAQTPYVRTLSKSGAILTELKDGRLVAAQHGGKFFMYWGEGMTYAATSDDLIRWTPIEIDAAPDRYLSYQPATDSKAARWKSHRVSSAAKALHPLAGPRKHRFDSLLTEPGPPAIRTKDGIVLIYNGANHFKDGEPNTPAGAYQPGQMLFDAKDPMALIAREREPFLRIDPVEAQGQVGNVCFAEGLVAFKGEWLLYVGLADSRLGVSSAPIRS